MPRVYIAGLVILGLLFFVWPIPRTISARDLLLVLTLGVFGYAAWHRGWPRRDLRGLRWPAALLAALTLWMYLVAFFISPETSWSLNEIGSQWIRALAALAAGVAVALAAGAESGPRQKALLVIVAALLLHVLIVDFQAIPQWYGDVTADLELSRISGLAGGSDKSNYLTNLVFCLLLAELLCRVLTRRRVLPVGHVWLGVALGAALFAQLAERMRNGMAVLVILLLATSLMYLFARRRRLKRRVLIVVVPALLAVLLGGMTLAMLIKPTKDPTSLQELFDTAVIAWDTEHYKAWQDEQKYGLPKLPSGQTVDPSAYQRIAWFKQGLLLIRDHPLGIGFGRNAYGHGLRAKYGQGGGHSHSGILDLTLGLGVPGALLWLGFFVSLLRLAWTRYRGTHSHAAALLLLLTLDFGSRMFVDSVVRDHMLQQFMFLAGLAGVMLVTEPEKGKTS